MERDRLEFNSARRVRSDMEDLAISAVAALQNASLLDEVKCRVFDRAPSELLEFVESTTGRGEYRYRPMVELLLHEIAAIGRDERDLAQQQRRIRWAVEMAGF